MLTLLWGLGPGKHSSESFVTSFPRACPNPPTSKKSFLRAATNDMSTCPHVNSVFLFIVRVLQKLTHVILAAQAAESRRKPVLWISEAVRQAFGQRHKICKPNSSFHILSLFLLVLLFVPILNKPRPTIGKVCFMFGTCTVNVCTDENPPFAYWNEEDQTCLLCKPKSNLQKPDTKGLYKLWLNLTSAFYLFDLFFLLFFCGSW